MTSVELETRLRWVRETKLAHYAFEVATKSKDGKVYVLVGWLYRQRNVAVGTFLDADPVAVSDFVDLIVSRAKAPVEAVVVAPEEWGATRSRMNSPGKGE